MANGGFVPPVRAMRGFTLMEVMIVVTVAGILLAVSAPGFQDVISRTVVSSQTDSLLSAVNLARSEAIRRNTHVTICASATGTACSANWAAGWLVFEDSDGDRTVDSGEEALRIDNGPGSGSTVTFSGGNNAVRYDSMGFSNDQGRFIICPADGDSAVAQGIDVSATGRAARLEDGLACA